MACVMADAGEQETKNFGPLEDVAAHVTIRHKPRCALCDICRVVDIVLYGGIDIMIGTNAVIVCKHRHRGWAGTEQSNPVRSLRGRCA